MKEVTQVVVGDAPLRIEDVVAVAQRGATVRLSEAPAFHERIEASVGLLRRRLSAGDTVYGVTTGFGDSCDNGVDVASHAVLAANLVRFHRCGNGNAFDEATTRAIVLVRLASLAAGGSAVRMEVLERLAILLERGVLPRIPERGSVGASGDLTPLAYVAAVLMGEGDALVGGEAVPSAEALRRVALTPLELQPKESLALMNGTSAMTGSAVVGFARAQRLARWTAALTAMAVEAMRGRPDHFQDRIFELKPHPGQRAFARWVREDLGPNPAPSADEAKLQDRYSLRCAPHVGGVLLDALPFARQLLETEIGSVNDNPIIDAETDRIYHGGNFYGGHVALVADTLKTAVANVADLLDRQLALLVSPVTNHGLPRDLVAPARDHGASHHGYKAMQITASALTAEALKATMPASVFSRSTENHNQDKVSMGTIAARDLSRVLDLTETVAAIVQLALCSALELRGGAVAGARSKDLLRVVRERVPPLVVDRPMDVDVDAVLELLRSEALPTGSADFG
jgi:histidine ammonia-lyase